MIACAILAAEQTARIKRDIAISSTIPSGFS